MTVRVYKTTRLKDGSHAAISFNPDSPKDVNNAFVDYLFFYHTRAMWEFCLSCLIAFGGTIWVVLPTHMSRAASDEWFFYILAGIFVASLVVFRLLRIVLFPRYVSQAKMNGLVD